MSLRASLAFVAVMAACASRDRAVVASKCPVNASHLLVDSMTVAGLDARSTIADLRRLCPSGRLDTVAVGGTQPVALSMTVAGNTVSAVQTKYEAYGDSLHLSEPADLWIVRGDSVRFADGTRIPMRVGQLRALDSTSVVVVDHGDDGPGSYIVRCKYPYVRVVIDNVWPSFADRGVTSIVQAKSDDSTRAWRIEIDRSSIDSGVLKACSAAPAT